MNLKTVLQLGWNGLTRFHVDLCDGHTHMDSPDCKQIYICHTKYLTKPFPPSNNFLKRDQSADNLLQYYFNPLMVKRYFLPLFNVQFSRNQCYKQLTLTFLTHYSLKLTIVSVKIYYSLYKLCQQKSANWGIFIFYTLVG